MTKRSAVSLVQRGDGRALCVWNKRYGFWSLPGGKVEEGESPWQAQQRELFEETDLWALGAAQIYEGPIASGFVLPQDADRIVHLFKVMGYLGVALSKEAGCPVGWFTPEEIMRWSGFREYYYRALGWVMPSAEWDGEPRLDVWLAERTETETLRREHKNMAQTLTVVQARCTELLEELRAARSMNFGAACASAAPSGPYVIEWRGAIRDGEALVTKDGYLTRFVPHTGAASWGTREQALMFDSYEEAKAIADVWEVDPTVERHPKVSLAVDAPAAVQKTSFGAVCGRAKTPVGWWCSRRPGHDGPCAAHPL
jgi:predicted NUDIX family NTP pyrophosphohydrolase